MKKVLIVLLTAAVALAGYLAYDWMAVARKRADAPVVTIYSWKDAAGSVHFSDKPPPSGARDIQKTRGHAYIPPPLVIRMSDTLSEWFGKAKAGISTRSEKRANRKSGK